MPAPRLALPARLGWPHWLGALLFGLMFVLLLLIVSWLLRACAPVGSLLNLTTLETDALPSARSPPDITPALRVSFGQTMADGQTLAAELESLQAEFKIKVASCKPVEVPKQLPLPADRWAKKDLGLLKGCWVLGHDARAVRGAIGSPERIENCTTKAARMCFDANGHGQSESTTVCPIAGTIYCARPVTARFANDGTFITTSPATQCQGGAPTHTEYSTGSCKRVDDYHATCRRTNFTLLDRPGTQIEEVEFRREP